MKNKLIFFFYFPFLSLHSNAALLFPNQVIESFKFPSFSCWFSFFHLVYAWLMISCVKINKILMRVPQNQSKSHEDEVPFKSHIFPVVGWYLIRSASHSSPCNFHVFTTLMTRLILQAISFLNSIWHHKWIPFAVLFNYSW